MTPVAQRPKIFLAILAFLVAIFACTALLRAQNLPPKEERDTPSSAGDPAMIARVNNTMLQARKLIDNFFQMTSNVVCTENVSQTLVLHANYEASYTFEPVGEEVVEGRTLAKVEFKRVPGTSSPVAIQLRGRNYPLSLKGDIWIDEESGAVVKLISSLDGGLDDLGLHDLRSEIHYSVVRFHDPEEACWMPASAVIDVETPKQHWRNVHRFADYKRFWATIQVELGDTQP